MKNSTALKLIKVIAERISGEISMFEAWGENRYHILIKIISPFTTLEKSEEYTEEVCDHIIDNKAYELVPRLCPLLEDLRKLSSIMDAARRSLPEEDEVVTRIYDTCMSMIEMIEDAALCAGASVPAQGANIIATTGKGGQQPIETPEARDDRKKAISSLELKRIFQGNSEELSKYILYCENARCDSHKAARAAELAKRHVIMKEDINGRLYDELKKYGYVKCSYKQWNKSTISKKRKN